MGFFDKGQILENYLKYPSDQVFGHEFTNERLDLNTCWESQLSERTP